ncbi:metal-dependent hydrolase [Lactococcus hodotermopsidis]|uniref:Metal-dependent hydrolase n=1 Tax=Pseudolactococcus hodotermopsidis TaxID=2709157 RepID=A0A6A0BC71_9LACT|nr:MBL fold metallo-hydrolase [Lactococcus hodotermopsidis]GFH42101.1 metal-dependent hydrolase [Lactococcus hodotermopsidis]
MKLTALGVWGGYPYKDAGTTSYLLTSDSGFNLLIDAGSRAVTELEHEISPLCLDAAIVSHYHEDHIADLGVLRQYRQLWPKTDPDWDSAILKIYGHDKDAQAFKNLTLDGVSKGIAYDVHGVQKVGPFDITFKETVHPILCYAMRIIERKTGQTLVFTGDTGWFDGLIDFANGVDMLLADVYFFADKSNMPNHLSSVEAGQAACQAGVKKLVLTHLPQFGDLEQLRKEAENAAQGVSTELAEPHKSWDFKTF